MKQKRIQIHCPYCGAKAVLRPASYVYGASLLERGGICICAPTGRPVTLM